MLMRRDASVCAASMRSVVVAGILVLAIVGSAQTASDRVDLRLDGQEAREVLTILDTPWAKPGVAPPDPQRLFSTPGYVRLKAREAAMERPFTDAEFMDFVRSNLVRSQADALKATLAEWEGADMQEAAQRALAYLP